MENKEECIVQQKAHEYYRNFDSPLYYEGEDTHSLKLDNEELKVTLGLIPELCSEKQAVAIDEFSITYAQNADTCSSRDETQRLKVTARNGTVDDDGWYCDIDTDGTHWSVDDPEEIGNIIRDFKRRLTMGTTKSYDLRTYNH